MRLCSYILSGSILLSSWIYVGWIEVSNPEIVLTFLLTAMVSLVILLSYLVVTGYRILGKLK